MRQKEYYERVVKKYRKTVSKIKSLEDRMNALWGATDAVNRIRALNLCSDFENDPVVSRLPDNSPLRQRFYERSLTEKEYTETLFSVLEPKVEPDLKPVDSRAVRTQVAEPAFPSEVATRLAALAKTTRHSERFLRGFIAQGCDIDALEEFGSIAKKYKGSISKMVNLHVNEKFPIEAIEKLYEAREEFPLSVSNLAKLWHLFDGAPNIDVEGQIAEFEELVNALMGSKNRLRYPPYPNQIVDSLFETMKKRPGIDPVTVAEELFTRRVFTGDEIEEFADDSEEEFENDFDVEVDEELQ